MHLHEGGIALFANMGGRAQRHHAIT